MKIEAVVKHSVYSKSAALALIIIFQVSRAYNIAQSVITSSYSLI
ncbi:hypothetical protein APHCR_0110 [Anaplasma phagocytophilum str. CR1007]|nr:hypothetical protein WSQ_02870 [Anaplasma phagocytophilum str. JM]AGR81895.1 hypothetical protein YYY_02875 [Anaplasma phagocytophilum str. Dog2]KJV82854.1 hypothetical protein APHHGE2_0882 [Anaplasma phagocytophilum str. HGE2]KJZ98491.1 hypothetical protein APHCR_0110 [Anaplasma phagocytophilum str. CR1007]